ncbi:hypothetical protein FRC01_010104 [Tulasnella sp. 417]|nr:hypothetical protein FRC01_010104 [Tulasnella sp. 417]
MTMSSPTSELPSPSPFSKPPSDIFPITSESLDLSLSTSALLRAATAAAHQSAEESAGAKGLLGGRLPKEEYTKFLFILWHLYHILEAALDAHASHPAIAPIYNPTILRRTDSLSADIASFLDANSSDPAVWQQHPQYESFLPFPAPVQAYLSRISSIASSPSEIHRLVAHAYVRYLGDLSGGQVIKRIVAKAYNLEDGEGRSFFEFARLGGPAGGDHAASGDIIKLKQWFRDGMDAGVRDDAEKQAVVEEANLVFKYNENLFQLLNVPEGEPHHHPKIRIPGAKCPRKVAASGKESLVRLVEWARRELSLGASIIPVSVLLIGLSYVALRGLKAIQFL